MKMRHLLVWSVLALTAQVLAANCAEWSTREFFESVTPAEVRSCLAAGAEVNARGERGLTPLHWAVSRTSGGSCNPAIIEILLEAGAEVNSRGNAASITPLYWAVSCTNPAVTRALLEAGAEVNVRSSSGNTPLHRAAMTNDNPAVIRALLEAPGRG